MRHVLILTVFFSLTGCAALQDKAVDYATESALGAIEDKLEDAITARGVETEKLKALFLADIRGRSSPRQASVHVPRGLGHDDIQNL